MLVRNLNRASDRVHLSRVGIVLHVRSNHIAVRVILGHLEVEGVLASGRVIVGRVIRGSGGLLIPGPIILTDTQGNGPQGICEQLGAAYAATRLILNLDPTLALLSRS